MVAGEPWSRCCSSSFAAERGPRLSEPQPVPGSPHVPACGEALMIMDVGLLASPFGMAHRGLARDKRRRSPPGVGGWGAGMPGSPGALSYPRCPGAQGWGRSGLSETERCAGP